MGYFSTLTSIAVPLTVENSSVSLFRQAQKFETPSEADDREVLTVVEKSLIIRVNL